MTVGEFREQTKDVDASAEIVTPDGLSLHVHNVSCGVVWMSDEEDEHTHYCVTCRQPVLPGTYLDTLVTER